MTQHSDNSDHHCTQESNIGEMMGLMKRIINEVYGNGQKGIAFTVPEMSIRIDNLASEIRNMAINVSALMKYMNETTTGKLIKDENKISRRGWAGMIITGIIGLTAIVLTLVQLYMRLHKMI